MSITYLSSCEEDVGECLLCPQVYDRTMPPSLLLLHSETLGQLCCHSLIVTTMAWSLTLISIACWTQWDIHLPPASSPTPSPHHWAHPGASPLDPQPNPITTAPNCQEIPVRPLNLSCLSLPRAEVSRASYMQHITSH